MEIFSVFLAICAGNSPVTVEFPQKGQWRGALMFSLICTSINGWVNNREAVDFRRHHAHYDVTVICDSWYKLVVVHAYCISKVVIHVYQAFYRLIVFNNISMQYSPIFICAELQMQPNWTDTCIFAFVHLVKTYADIVNNIMVEHCFFNDILNSWMPLVTDILTIFVMFSFHIWKSLLFI